MSEKADFLQEMKNATGKLDAFNKHHAGRCDAVENRLNELEQHVVNMPAGGIPVGTSGAGGSSMIANQFTASDSFKAMLRGANSSGRVEIPAALNAITSTGQGGTERDVQPQRASEVYNDPRRRLSILGLMPTLPVKSGKFEYLRLDGYNNSAAVQVKEGDTKAQGDVPTELIEVSLPTIAHFVKASVQILDDEPALQRQINSLLSHGLMAKLESMIVSGTGVGGEINGLLNQAAAFAATLALSPVDKIGEAITALDSGGWSPSAIVMNPKDWFTVSAERATDNQYVLGSPRNPSPPNLWGTPVTTTPSLAEGTAIVLDTSQTAILDRQQPTLMASRHDASNFTSNLVTILGEMRAGLAIFSAGAVLSVDITEA